MNLQVKYDISYYLSVNSAYSVFSAVQTNGNAVYRARVLHGMYHFGIHYDDLEICNGQGVYKNGTNKLQEQLDLLNNYTNNKKVVKGKVMPYDEVLVYPNPADNYINIVCQNAKQVVITDVLGELKLKRNLDESKYENRMEIGGLPIGVYFYKILRKDGGIYIGKLIIE